MCPSTEEVFLRLELHLSFGDPEAQMVRDQRCSAQVSSANLAPPWRSPEHAEPRKTGAKGSIVLSAVFG